MNLSAIQTIENVDVAGKRVIMRADLNVPVAADGTVSDATRLKRLIPGLKALNTRGAKVIIISHFARPKGERRADMSLNGVADKLSELAGMPVAFADDCVGPVAQAAVDALEPGGIVVLENLRFHAGEEVNDAAFCQQLAALGDLFVNDAFSAAHRAHASTEGIARLLPHFAGPLMMEEINALRTALDAPKRPIVAVVGGAKVSSKIPVLTNIVSKVDNLIIGGGMANTFLMAQGINIGASLAEPDFQKTAREILTNAEASGCTIVLPIDVVVAQKFEAGTPSHTKPVGEVADDTMILDIGAQSVAAMSDVFRKAKTLLWNGPVGAFEISPFGEGTFQLAAVAAELTKSAQLTSIAGGGDTVAALNAAGVSNDFSYVSTAGGAFLEWLEGRELPGVAALA